MCTLCYGVGWILSTSFKQSGKLTLEIIPCLIPDCEFSGRSVELISINELKFNTFHLHPTDNYIMSISK